MTKGRAALPGSAVAEQEPFFIFLGGPTGHDYSGLRSADQMVKAPVTDNPMMLNVGETHKVF
jgi:hypothetical protein